MVVAALGYMQGLTDASRSGDTRRAQGVLRAGPSYQPRYSSLPAGGVRANRIHPAALAPGACWRGRKEEARDGP